ncbi:vWA domain-containing protein [Limnochorda pilosa]|nr:VWA domain-containing protein [Limnochorda pilosa]
MDLPALVTRPEVILANLLVLERLLRLGGLGVGPERMALALKALEVVGVHDRERVQGALRCVAASGREEARRFDQVFQVFLGLLAGRREDAELAARTLGASAAAQRERWRRAPSRNGAPPSPGETARPTPARVPWQVWEGHGGDEVPEGRPAGGYSPAERLAQKDFARYDAADRGLALQRLETLAWQGVRRSHRWRRSTRGHGVDLRRALRETATRGEVWALPRRRRRERLRPGVVLLDVSGSMEPYAWPLLALAHHLVARRQPVEVFLFGTRLTRVTRLLRRRPVEEALRRAVSEVPDWSGGTRIGENLGRFNRAWARRVATRGAVVMVVSDGLDRGDPRAVAREMAHLQRTAHRLIWLNPLLGGEGYQPLAAGMQAALPFVDDFLPMARLADVEGLLRRLQAVGSRRPVRRQQAR